MFKNGKIIKKNSFSFNLKITETEMLIFFAEI